MQECTTLKQALFLLKIHATQGGSRKRITGLQTWRAGPSCLEVAGSRGHSPQFSHRPFLFIRRDAVTSIPIEPSPLRQPPLLSLSRVRATWPRICRAPLRTADDQAGRPGNFADELRSFLFVALLAIGGPAVLSSIHIAHILGIDAVFVSQAFTPWATPAIKSFEDTYLLYAIDLTSCQIHLSILPTELNHGSKVDLNLEICAVACLPTCGRALYYTNTLVR